MVRKASEAPTFPYGYPGKVCYFTLTDGVLVQCSTRPEIRKAVTDARAGRVKIYAVWPGQWKSDLFEIDNPDLLAESVETKWPTPS